MIQYHEPIPARRGWERKGRWFCKIEVATPVYVRNAPDCQQSKCKFCDDNPPSPWGGISCANKPLLYSAAPEHLWGCVRGLPPVNLTEV